MLCVHYLKSFPGQTFSGVDCRLESVTNESGYFGTGCSTWCQLSLVSTGVTGFWCSVCARNCQYGSVFWLLLCPLMQNQRSTMASSDVAYVQAAPLATDGDGLGYGFTRCSSRAVTWKEKPWNLPPLPLQTKNGNCEAQCEIRGRGRLIVPVGQGPTTHNSDLPYWRWASN